MEKKIKKNDLLRSNKKIKRIVFNNLKFILGLILITLLVNGFVRIDAYYLDLLNKVSGEDTLTELVQLFLVLVTIYSFFKLSYEKKELKKASVLVGSFFVVVFIRELDFLFDRFYHGFWAIPALLVTLSSLYYAFRDWKDGINQLCDFLDTRAMIIIITGTILLFFYSRLIGMGTLWKEVMGENYVYRVKMIIEESTELLCYFLIAFGAISLRKEIKNKNNR